MAYSADQLSEIYEAIKPERRLSLQQEDALEMLVHGVGPNSRLDPLMRLSMGCLPKWAFDMPTLLGAAQLLGLDELFSELLTLPYEPLSERAQTMWLSSEETRTLRAPRPKRQVFLEGYDRASFYPEDAEWYARSALVHACRARVAIDPYGRAAPRLIRTVLEALHDAGRYDCDVEIATVALETLTLLLGSSPSKKTDYDVRAELTQAAGAMAEPLLRAQKGAYRALFVAIPDVSTEGMVRGLREVAATRRFGLLSYLGRAPTVDELCAVTNQGLVMLLRMMPWELLQPAVSADGPRLQAQLLPHLGAGDLETLREALVPQRSRLELRPRPQLPPRRDSPDQVPLYLQRALRAYSAGRRYRNTLHAAYPNHPNVRRLFAAYHLFPRAELQPFIEGSPNPQQILEAAEEHRKQWASERAPHQHYQSEG